VIGSYFWDADHPQRQIAFSAIPEYLKFIFEKKKILHENFLEHVAVLCCRTDIIVTFNG